MDLMVSLNDLIENSDAAYYEIISWLAPWLSQYLVIRDIYENGVIKCAGKNYPHSFDFSIEIYMPGEAYMHDITMDKWTIILYGISRERFDLSDPDCLSKILQTLKEHKQIDKKEKL